MKTKKFMMLLAAVLLSGASAFAQSESETLKGDVNEDGVVDVADINAVIEIMKAGGGTVEPTTYYFSIGTTPVTAENYTTANNATTTIPTTIEYTSSQRVRHYVLIPDNMILSITDKYVGAVIPMTEDTSAAIPNHKLYYTNGAIANGGTVVITLTPSEPQPTVYYWYVGTTVPTDPTNSSENTGNNQWTSLGTDLPTSDIKVAKVDYSYQYHTWYIAAPSAANFTLYNGTNVASAEATWNKSTFNVGSVEYTLWTSKATGYQAVAYLHK